MQTSLLTQLLQFNQHSGCCCCCCFISVLEPDISVPRKPPEKSSFKWAVACGIIVCAVLTLTAGLYFILRRFFGLPNDIPFQGDRDGYAFPRLKILLERLDRATFGMGIGEGKQVDEI